MFLAAASSAYAATLVADARLARGEAYGERLSSERDKHRLRDRARVVRHGVRHMHASGCASDE